MFTCEFFSLARSYDCCFSITPGAGTFRTIFWRLQKALLYLLFSELLIIRAIASLQQS
jgi:hypothetical protein